MGACDRVAPRIPWHVQGKLPEAERSEVELHLRSCPACAGLLEEASEMKEVYAAASAAALEDHPHAQLLGEVAEDPGALEDGTIRWVLAHAARCEGCGEALQACRAQVAAADPARPARAGAPAGLASRIRGLLAGSRPAPWLRPAPALAYLLAAIALAIPAFRHLTGPARDSGAVASLPREIVVQGDLVRSGIGAEPIEIPRGGAVALLLRTGIDRGDLRDPAAAFRVDLRSGAEVIWSERRPGSAFGDDATIRVVIDPGKLVPGREHLLAIVYEKPGDPMDGRAVFGRAFRVAEQAGDGADR